MFPGILIIMENIITVKNLVKKFGHFIANDHLNFEVRKGEILGFLGANGAGKTTAIRILCGLSYPTSGEVKWEALTFIPSGTISNGISVI